jgi:murein DD-endopeptidase MepM/ murein hydrolase activator NlpD
VALHSGIDLAAPAGSTVRSAAAGTVAFVGEKDSYGQLIVINHSQGYQTRYAQLASIQVKLGQAVNAGDPIGTVGQTGQPSSTAAHLHFELRSNSKLGWVAEDPAPSLK